MDRIASSDDVSSGEFHDARETYSDTGSDDDQDTESDVYASASTLVMPTGRSEEGNLTVRQASADTFPVAVVADDGEPDDEVLQHVPFKNLDTNETLTLAESSKVLPEGIDPLSIVICSLKGVSDADNDDGEMLSGYMHKIGSTADKIRKGSRVKKLATALKRSSKKPPSPTGSFIVDAPEVKPVEKGEGEFAGMYRVQELALPQMGAIWTMKFSDDGRLLAVAGQDRVVRVWCVAGMGVYFDEMKRKYASDSGGPQVGHQRYREDKTAAPPRPPPPNRSFLSPNYKQKSISRTSLSSTTSIASQKRSLRPIFDEKPYIEYEGHEADVLDLSWSKVCQEEQRGSSLLVENHFLLTSSMDKTVRLWHISQAQCLCVFHHPDFVTSIAFHPKDDRYFVSGSLDCRVRMWNIPQKKVIGWNEIDNGSIVTAVSFCSNGRMVVVGTYDGRCLFYDSELKYHTQILVKRKGKKHGRKISGIIPVHGENKILVSSNDSRVRLYDLTDFSLACKFRGVVNTSSQIRASMSQDTNYVICGSEDSNIYIWNVNLRSNDAGKEASLKYRNDSYEAYNAHDHAVTVALFAPYSTAPGYKTDTDMPYGEVVVTADAAGHINVLLNVPVKESLQISAPWWADDVGTATA